MKLEFNKQLLGVSKLILAEIIIKPVSLVALIFYMRYLSKEELSILPIFEMLGSMSSIILGFGLFPTFIRNLPQLFKKSIEEARSIIASGSLILFSSSLIFSIIIYIYSNEISILLFKHSEYTYFLKIMCLGFTFMTIRKIFEYILWSSSRFSLMSINKIIYTILNASLSICLYFLFGLKGLVLGLVFKEIISAIIAFLFIKDILYIKKIKFYPIKDLLSKSFPFYIESYFIYFIIQGDNWIIASFLGPIPLSIYYVAKRLYNFLYIFYDSFDKVVTAELAKNIKSPDIVIKKLIKITNLTMQALVPSVLFIISLIPAFIQISSDDKYIESIIPSIILCFTILIQFLWRPINRVLFIINPPITRLKLTLMESFTFIISLFLFTKILSEIGVALSLFLSNILGGIYAIHILRRNIDFYIPIQKHLTSIIISFVMSFYLIIFSYLYPELHLILIHICIAFIIFLILTSFFNSSQFYSTVNSIFPIKIYDPIRKYFRKINVFNIYSV